MWVLKVFNVQKYSIPIHLYIIINFYIFLGFYTGWLLPAALLGLFVFLYGIMTMDQNVIAQEVCSEQAKK